MGSHRFDQLARRLAGVSTATQRRTLFQGAAALGAALSGVSLWPEETGSKNKKKRKRKNKHKNKNKKGLCRQNGTTCSKESKKCKAKHCLSTPFTTEAHWTTESDLDTYFFVPNETGVSLPSPYIAYSCTPDHSDCELDLYPFTCISEDAQGPGDEVTTVRQLIPGEYCYWIELQAQSAAGDLTVTLRRSNGSVVQSWSSPENGDDLPRGWEVFKIDGETKSITSIDQLIDDILPEGAHDPSTDVCQYSVP